MPGHKKPLIQSRSAFATPTSAIFVAVIVIIVITLLISLGWWNK